MQNKRDVMNLSWGGTCRLFVLLQIAGGVAIASYEKGREEPS